MKPDLITYLLSFFFPCKAVKLKFTLALFFSADVADITLLLGVWMLIIAKEGRLMAKANIL